MEINTDLHKYFTTLTKNRTDISTSAKINIYGYNKLGYVLESILNVCRQGLEAERNDLQIAQTLDYCNLLELATDLIPHDEFQLLDKLHAQANSPGNENH